MYIYPQIFGGKSTWPLFKISLQNKAISLHNTSIMHFSNFKVLVSLKWSKISDTREARRVQNLQIFKCQISTLPCQPLFQQQFQMWGKLRVIVNAPCWNTRFGTRLDFFLQVCYQCTKLICIIRNYIQKCSWQGFRRELKYGYGNKLPSI